MKRDFSLIMLTKLFVLILSFAVVQSGPPLFDTSFETYILEEGTVAQVLCSARNDSPLMYKWYNQFEDEIRSEANATISTRPTPNGSELIFKSIDSSQGGKYTCTAENSHGLVSKVYDIIVNSDNTTITINKVDIRNVTDSTVEFAVDTSIPAEAITVKYSEKIDTTVRTYEFKIGEKVEIEDLIPSGLYSVQFQARSSKGDLSNWYEKDRVVPLPAVPDVVFRSLTGGTVQFEWARSFHDYRRRTIVKDSLSYVPVSRGKNNTWDADSCIINIEIPYPSCPGPRYSISGLREESYYEIRLKTHTEFGYGKPFIFRIYIQK